MAIRKQNTILLTFVVIVLAGLGYILLREGKLASLQSSDSETAANAGKTNDPQESLGDQIENPATASAGTLERQKTFSIILNDLGECLGVKSPAAADATPVNVDSMISNFQSELGAVSGQSDRWMNWHLRNRDGQERRLHLEIKDGPDGRPQRDLHYFSADRMGQLTSIELEDSRRENPSDEAITTMLREGEVFYKDRAAFVTFAGGERIEYVEKNGELSEIEFIKGDSFFRCGDLSTRENCQCTK